ncbi:AAA family ATPase [Geobacillus stearothermophilus]|uniref:AAA family ATPase n=1 Tax=Geobacillus stearothermophilus TaxID=1422 RepID=UPI002E1AC5A6|nr:AAA family ATPase [Geobacillus stearothermophilus]
MSEGRKLFPKDPPNTSTYKEIDRFLESSIGDDCLIQDREAQLFVQWFNDVLRNKKSELVRTIFRRKIPIGSLSLPLYVTSSLVTELSPLILFLKSKATYRSLFFEEAEAHLHPRVQRILATALVKLANRGMPVWLTTHSDILFQQVNNLIKLHQHPKREQLMKTYGYVDEDAIDPKKVRAYQFRMQGQDTIITPLIPTENGFPAETFNEVLGHEVPHQRIPLNDSGQGEYTL